MRLGVAVYPGPRGRRTPDGVRRAGEFTVEIAGRDPRAADAHTVVTTLLLAAVFFPRC